MEQKIGKKLLQEHVVTEKQLKKALNRQRLHGGRLGNNLVTLGYITPDKLKDFFARLPRPPENVRETGLELDFIADLIMKHILFKGEFTLGDISDSVKLPIPVVDAAVETLRRDKLVEVRGAAQYAKVTYKFNITGPGKKRASELLDICRYVGPAPVPLDEYRTQVEFQSIKNIFVSEQSVKEAFSDLVIRDDLLMRLGPAVSSGKAIFLHGPPGNGKTAIAETIGNILPGNVYVPYSMIVGGQIIAVFDPSSHKTVTPDKGPEEVDQRWLVVKRPVVMTGGEFTLKMLELEFNPVSKFYVAPLQVKANNGLFIVDDFGRQQIDPQGLLNRWIVPLERRVDFLALHTGMKFEVPFDQLTIFATNIKPQKLVDDAFLRRIRYKIAVEHPTEHEYHSIFKMVCESNGIEYNQEIFDYLINNYYKRLGMSLNACHPRDLIEHIIDNAHYYSHAPELTREHIDAAWKSYFIEA